MDDQHEENRDGSKPGAAIKTDLGMKQFLYTSHVFFMLSLI